MGASVEEEALSTVVFVVSWKWDTSSRWTGTPEQQYQIVARKVGVRAGGSSLFLGCRETGLGGMEFHAIGIFRSEMKLLGEAAEFVPGCGRIEMAEPLNEHCVERFVEEKLLQCAAGGETYGERVRLSSLDVNAWQMLRGRRCRLDRGSVRSQLSMNMHRRRHRASKMGRRLRLARNCHHGIYYVPGKSWCSRCDGGPLTEMNL